MFSKAILVVSSAVLGAALVSAQAAPNWRYIPSACATQCASVARSASLCETQFPNDYTNIYGCYCNALPTDSAGCATCLTSNNAAALGRLITSTVTECPAAVKACFFQCSIVPCPATDIACQCSGGYLQDIHDCGACNTANGNTQATQLKDWEALRNSCRDQNFPAANGTFGTRPAPSPTGVAQYVPVSLTAVGGGAAATGDLEDLAQTGAAATTRRPVAAQSGAAGGAASAGGASAAVTGSNPARVSGSAAAVAGASGAAAASGARPSVSGSKAPAASSVAPSAAGVIVQVSRAAADSLVVPATGLMAVLGGVLALL